MKFSTTTMGLNNELKRRILHGRSMGRYNKYIVSNPHISAIPELIVSTLCKNQTVHFKKKTYISLILFIPDLT